MPVWHIVAPGRPDKRFAWLAKCALNRLCCTGFAMLQVAESLYGLI